MSGDQRISHRNMLFILHPIFALTGIADATTGPMLPLLAQAYHLSDNQSGQLLFCIFAGMSVGALLCRGDYARILTSGLFGLTISCLCFPLIPRAILYPSGFFFGISVGAPMTATSLFAGRNYPLRRAATLTLLNLTWSAGAMLAPLLAARVLAVFSWGTVYIVLGCASGLACIVASFTIRDTIETARTTRETTGLRNVRMVTLFALFFFLEVGMESMFGAWISTYLLRNTFLGLTLAAAATAIYWTGFLVSRALSPLLLLRLLPNRLLRLCLSAALCAAIFLSASRSPALLIVAILLLGMALAPIFPVALAAFFDRARHSSDTRFILTLSGFGGSVLPWLAGWLSSRTGSLRIGLLVGPVTLLALSAMLPLLHVSRPVSSGTTISPLNGGRKSA